MAAAFCVRPLRIIASLISARNGVCWPMFSSLDSVGPACQSSPTFAALPRTSSSAEPSEWDCMGRFATATLRLMSDSPKECRPDELPVLSISAAEEELQRIGREAGAQLRAIVDA